jgi:hypothetical protein
MKKLFKKKDEQPVVVVVEPLTAWTQKTAAPAKTEQDNEIKV